VKVKVVWTDLVQKTRVFEVDAVEDIYEDGFDTTLADVQDDDVEDWQVLEREVVEHAVVDDRNVVLDSKVTAPAEKPMW
jgi:hypothetical protein